jgi:Protein of unknown function (DUF1573)
MKNNILKCLFAFALILPISLMAQTTTAATKTSAVKKAPVKKPTAKPGTKATTTASKTEAVKKEVTPALIMPVMAFGSKFTNFGKVKTGDKPAYTYEFTNTGTAPMDIEICSGCECTEIDWTRTTIQPGEKGFVKAVFNTSKAEPEDHKKQLTKYIDIILKQSHPKSGYPIVESVKFDVFIID